MMAGSLVTGVIADRHGRLKCIIYANFMQFIVASTFILVQNPTQVIILRFFYGFIYGIY